MAAGKTVYHSFKSKRYQQLQEVKKKNSDRQLQRQVVIGYRRHVMAGRVLVSCHWLRDVLTKQASRDVRILETAWATNSNARDSFLQ